MDQTGNISKEQRIERRQTDLSNCRVEIKLVGRPFYQFKLRDVSSSGAGILVKDNSGFLSLIENNQVLEVDFIDSNALQPAGMHRAAIKHITKIEDGRYKGHRLIGVSILENPGQLPPASRLA